jgi:hypothetical protein
MIDRLRQPLKLALPALCLWVLSSGCEGGATARELGSETHFLGSCATTCDGGLSCVCGVCTKLCDEDGACQALSADAACVPAAAHADAASCAASETRSFCDVSCSTDADCSSLDGGARCDAGFCRPGAAPNEPACERSDMTGSRVAVFGDALIELTPFTTHLEELARNEGSLAPGGRFRSYATALNSFLAGATLSLSVQYDQARGEGPLSVAVMNGGETDMLQGTCGDAPEPDCAAVQAAADGLSTLFSRMAADGVTEVVYFFYADPVERPMVKAGLDTLRPLVQDICGTAPLPCHFIDLRPVFENHYDEYVSTDGLVFSEDGARAAAATVWQRMQSECVTW